MAMKDRSFKGGEGLIEKDIEETIKNIGYLGKVGMKETDITILNTMIHKVNVSKALEN